MIISIDGPAASGKSTTARKVAEVLGFTYLDTGAMYRAVTLTVIEKGIDLDDEAALIAVLSDIDINFSTDSGVTVIKLDHRDVTEKIRSVQVTSLVSAVSAIPTVRESMVILQRKLGRQTDCVVEGRDIGTVVFPEADYKFFLVADYETRAKRRQLDLQTMDVKRTVKELVIDLKHRDEQDSTRDHSPLKKASDAIEVDTTDLSFDKQVMLIINHIKQGINKGN